MDAAIDQLSTLAAAGDAAGIRALLRRIVPTYHDPAPEPDLPPAPAAAPLLPSPAGVPALSVPDSRPTPCSATALAAR